MPNQYGEAAAGTSTVDPLQELKAWKEWRDSILPPGVDLKKLDPATKARVDALIADPEMGARFNGEMLSPDAKAYTRGAGVNGQHFDIKTGEIRKNKGFWQLPESYAILAMGAGLGAGVGLAAAGAAGASGAASSAAPAAAAAGGTGATTATTAASAVGAAAKGGIKNWLTGNAGSLISEGVGAVGGVIASKKAAGAADEAARLEAEAYDKALAAEREQKDYDRNQYADYLGRLDPYTQTGYGANDRLAAFSGQAAPPRPAPLQRPVMTTPAAADTMPYGQRVPPGIQTAGAGMTPAAAANTPPQLVKLSAPDGSIKDVPADQAEHFIKLGARPVQATA